MKSLHRRATRLRFAAWQPRSSQLGIFYLLAVLTTFGVIFRLIFVFFAMTQQCYPVWDFWLAGFNQYTSLFQIVIACFIGLAILTTIDLSAYLRSSHRIRASRILIYLTLLAFPVSTLIMFYLFWGAMMPESDARHAYDQAVEFSSRRYRVFSTYGPPEGPFGTCPTDSTRWIYGSPPPETIGAL